MPTKQSTQGSHGRDRNLKVDVTGKSKMSKYLGLERIYKIQWKAVLLFGSGGKFFCPFLSAVDIFPQFCSTGEGRWESIPVGV